MRLAFCLIALMLACLPERAAAQALERQVDQWLAVNDGRTKSFEGISRVVNSHPDWPYLNKFRGQAEAVMPSSLPDAQVIAWFAVNPPQTGTGAMRYGAALLNQGRTAEGRTVIRDAWTEKSMSREEQRAFYTRFSGQLDKEASVRRLDRQLLRGNYTNARAVAEALGGGYPALAEARIALAMDHGNVEALIARVPGALQAQKESG